MTCGMPFMALDRQDHFGKRNEHTGNARAVLTEGLEERRSSDPDLDRERTGSNLYALMSDVGVMWFSGDELAGDPACADVRDLVVTSGDDLADQLDQAASEHTTMTKDGKVKRLRSDAKIGFAGIVKPEKEYMDGLSREEQIRYLTDSADVILGMCQKRGLEVAAMVIHLDEGNPHLHYYGRDPEYKLTKKTGLPWYRALNVTEYPVGMREKGWPIEDLTGYLEDTAGMDDQGREEYKRKRRAERKEKHGQPSSAYKAARKAKADSEALEARERVVVEKEAEVRRKGLEAAQRLQEAKKRAKIIDDREAAVEEKEKRLEKLVKLGRQAAGQAGDQHQPLQHPERKGFDLDF